MAKQPRRPNKTKSELERWGEDVIKEDIRREMIGQRPSVTEELEDALAADRRQKEENTWPVNDYVLGAALLLIGVIILIAIAIFTGLVKP